MEDVFGGWLEDKLCCRLMSRSQIMGLFKKGEFKSEESKRDSIELFNSFLNDRIFTKTVDDPPYYMDKNGKIERCGVAPLEINFRGSRMNYNKNDIPVKCLVENEVKPFGITVLEFYDIKGKNTGEYAYKTIDSIIHCKKISRLLDKHLK